MTNVLTMSQSLKMFFRNSNYLLNITKPVQHSATRKCPVRCIVSGITFQNTRIWKPFNQIKQISVSSCQIRNYTGQGERDPCKQPPDCKTGTSPGSEPSKPPLQDTDKKPGLIQRFKQMYRDYWYVLVPVHMATSAVWLGSFYYVVRSGVDILGLVESLGVSDKLIEPLRDSNAGYFALTFALYKIATPLRYAVTLGGTTVAIRRLTAMGWIKPVPSRERLKEMLQERRDTFQDRFSEGRQQMKQHSTKVVEEMRRYKTEMRNVKNKVKKT